MKIDPKGLARESSSRQAGESCMARYESANETLRSGYLVTSKPLEYIQ